MDIASKHVFGVSGRRKVMELHHANSVATACQFIRASSLMSWGRSLGLGLRRTCRSRTSWIGAIAYGLTSSRTLLTSIAEQGRSMVDGPVLFVFDLDILDRNGTGRMWVIKGNPISCRGKSDEERWLQDGRDLERHFVKGRFNQMIVLRHCGGVLPFGSYLSRIVLDDPQQVTEDGVDFYSMVVGALRLSMQDAGIDVPTSQEAVPSRVFLLAKLEGRRGSGSKNV